jgi:hypothetical protein
LFNWNSQGFLQPHSILNSETKLENSVQTPELASLLSVQKLVQGKLPSYIDLYVKTNGQTEYIASIKEFL